MRDAAERQGTRAAGLARVPRGYPSLPLVRDAIRVLVPALKKGALPPPSARPWDGWRQYRVSEAVIDAQKLATRILHVFGIEATRVLVVFDEKLDAAGRIELHGRPGIGGGEYFVEVRDELRAHPKKVAATLGHEVAHIFLRRHGLERRDTFANEILTDTVAALYGFGALMADTYEVSETRWSDGEGRTWLERRESSMGYLTPDELGYVLARGGFADVDAYLQSAHARDALRAGRDHAARELRAPPLRVAPLWERAMYQLRAWYAGVVRKADAELFEDQLYAVDAERVTFRCPQCTQPIRLPRRKRLTAKCPTCEHRAECVT